MSQEFFSALGGAISLFLGVSFIMIMEVLELFWDFIMNILRNENYPHFNVMDKARDQKQIYRLNETVSHWGLNPPP